MFNVIFIGFVLFKGYILVKDYKKEIGNLTYSHSKIKELEDEIIQLAENTTINNHNSIISDQKHNLPAPKIILDNRTYSQQEFSKETTIGRFQMSPMLQSKLYKKNK